MAQFDTTATAQEDVYIAQTTPNTNFDGSANGIVIQGNLTNVAARGLLSFRVPTKPTFGADRIDRTRLVLTLFRSDSGVSVNRFHRVFQVVQPWTEGSATWNNYTGGAALQTAGGDKGPELTSRAVSISYGASAAYDVGAVGLDWGGHGSVLIQDSSETGATGFGPLYFSLETVATTAWMPHVTITATDDPPTAINDLSV